MADTTRILLYVNINNKECFNSNVDRILHIIDALYIQDDMLLLDASAYSKYNNIPVMYNGLIEDVYDTYYILTIDADTIIEGFTLSHKQSLTLDSYYIYESHNGFLNAKIRIARKSKESHTIGRLSNDVIFHITSKTKTIMDHANDLIDQCKYDAAILACKEIIDNKSDDDESIWYAHMMVGVCYELTKNFQLATSWYWLAYMCRTSRREPLLKLCTMLRISGKVNYYESYKFAKLASNITFPLNDNYFININDYVSKIDTELSIVGYYLPDKKTEAYFACERVLCAKDSAPFDRQLCNVNLFYYCKPIKKHSVKENNAPFLSELYHASSPSIVDIPDSDYAYVNVRQVNYNIINEKYVVIDGSGIVNTRNVLYKLNKHTFELSEPREIIENKHINTRIYCITGLEDVRLFMWKGDLYGAATVLNVTDRPQICVFKIDVLSTTQNIRVDITVIDYIKSNCEKNWTPTSSNTDELTFVYNHNPFTLLTIEKSLNRVVNVQSHDLPSLLYDMRGSTRLEAYNGGYISITHKVFNRGYRVYVHRFIIYDNCMLPVKFSEPFYFSSLGIEYVCGLHYDNKTNSFIVGYSENDKNSFLCKVDVETVEKLHWHFMI